MNNFHAGWYLIYTRPRHEKKVHARLTERRVNSFLPTKKTLRTWHDRKKYVDEPLFPSYVFLYLDNMQNYYEGVDAEGALYYVRTGGKMARVSDLVVNNIKLATGHSESLEISDDSFQPGQRLVISHGPLTGLSCEVIQLEKKHKLLIRVDLLQRHLLLSLPEEYLMAI